MSHLRTLALTVAFLAATIAGATADERLIRLAVPQELQDSGLLQYMLPRFSLKTQVKVQVVTPGEAADCALGTSGEPVFSGLGQTWGLVVLSPGHGGSEKFADWIRSATGQSAVTGFAPDGTAVFTLPAVEAVVVEAPEFDADAVEGKSVAKALCGRCHVTARGPGSSGIGSTPSFYVLRGFGDWVQRFSAFYVLKPHGAFTQVEDVTEPFPMDRPPPIVPISLTLDDLEAIMAYVAELDPADLGAPLQNQ